MAYASVAQLQPKALSSQTTAPTQQQMEQMQRNLDEAAAEIDWELGYTAENPSPSPPHPLVVGVNLDRALEHWKQEASPFGVIGVGPEAEPIIAARNSWYRHARKLAPLKTRRGIA